MYPEADIMSRKTTLWRSHTLFSKFRTDTHLCLFKAQICSCLCDEFQGSVWTSVVLPKNNFSSRLAGSDWPLGMSVSWLYYLMWVAPLPDELRWELRWELRCQHPLVSCPWFGDLCDVPESFRFCSFAAIGIPQPGTWAEINPSSPELLLSEYFITVTERETRAASLCPAIQSIMHRTLLKCKNIYLMKMSKHSL